MQKREQRFSKDETLKLHRQWDRQLSVRSGGEIEKKIQIICADVKERSTCGLTSDLFDTASDLWDTTSDFRDTASDFRLVV